MRVNGVGRNWIAAALAGLVAGLGSCHSAAPRSTSATISPSVRDLLKQFLASDDEGEVVWALQTMGAMAEPLGDLWADVDRLRASKSSSIREGVRYLDRINGSESPPLDDLVAMASSGDGWTACAAAILARRIGVDGARVWLAGVKNGDYRCRILSIRALADNDLVAGNQDALLAVMRTDRHPEVRIEAACSLVQGTSAADAIDALLAAVTDPEWGAIAVDCVTTCGDGAPGLREQLVPILIRASQSTDEVVAYLSMRSLTEWGRTP